MNQALRNDVCETCGGPVKEYYHSLTRGLVDTLVKFGYYVRNKGLNKAHIIDEVGLSIPQYCNFQKLKYFGLVAKWKDPNGSTKTGYWVLTMQGLEFLKDRASVAKKVKTFRGVKISEEGPYVKISDFHQAGDPYWEQEFSFEIHDYKIVPTILEPQMSML